MAPPAAGAHLAQSDSTSGRPGQTATKTGQKRVITDRPVQALEEPRALDQAGPRGRFFANSSLHPAVFSVHRQMARPHHGNGTTGETANRIW